MELFASEGAYQDILAGLRGLSYRGSLIEENYRFTDWFSTSITQCKAAAFAQTPVSYESACIGVVQSNGLQGPELINKCRSLGAPVVLELAKDEVREWLVSRDAGRHALVSRHPFSQINKLFATRAVDWKPESLLRAKNIGSFRWAPQLTLFAGLLPELEEHIQESLDPLLRDALSATRQAYQESTGREPDPSQIFRLVFWLLTAKVFRDRQVDGFVRLGEKPDPDELLQKVADQYREPETPRLLNRFARETAVSRIWANLDFRNLSVEILSQIWATTLVDDVTKKRLGIHRTPRTIVRYIIDRIPFEQWGDDQRIILEPCCGSGVFLIGAMNKLRYEHALFGATPSERHAYFVKHLAGIEKDPFGVEISRLALTLADFPNPGGWNIAAKDVFDEGVLEEFLPRSGVVLCNPPFRDFDLYERDRYRYSSPLKPVELLNRVLDQLHPSGVLGFVLPRQIVDGRGYAGIRRRLTERFANIDLTVLPDRAFEADPEVALLIATEPIPHNVSTISFKKVDDDVQAWHRFELKHEVTFDHVAEVDSEHAEESLGIPELPEVWDFLINFPVLEEVAVLHRGIEWNKPLTKKGGIETGNREKLVRDKPASRFWPGVPPLAKFSAFEVPKIRYLSLREEDARGSSYTHAWEKPKAIVNKAARRRGKWRMAAFPDSEGLTCYQSFIGVWPKSRAYDEWILAAVLNSPVANAFVATREGKTDITLETLARVPMPHLTEVEATRLRSMVRRYQASISVALHSNKDRPSLERALMEIDALVLSAYHMPPRIERALLDFFMGANRPVPHAFGDYYPKDFEGYFSLMEFLSPQFAATTANALLNRLHEYRGGE